MISLRRYWAKLLGTLLFVGALFGTADAHAVYKFCTDIHYTFEDDGFGEDYLLPGGTIRAANHWMVIKYNNNVLWSGYADSSGCGAALSSGAGNYVVETYPQIQVGSSLINIFPTTVGSWVHVWYQFNNLPSSTHPSVTYKVAQVGSGIAGEDIFNVSAALTRLTQPESGFDFGLRAGSYNILASQQCPGAISCFSPGASASGDVLYLGYDSDLWGWDHKSKYIIGHEMGHFVQHRLFGSPSGQTSYCHNVPTGGNNLCRCDHVLSPADTFCTNVPVNQVHCFQSRENLTAALGEGFGHFFATTLFNNPTGADARFVYYKHFKRADLQVVAPPVWHDPMLMFRWMENYCGAQMAGLGTEMDWMGFLYRVRSTTSTPYTYTDLESVFEHSQVCSGTCNSSDTVTWAKLQAAAVALYPLAKENHFINNGDSYGVNH